MKLCFNPVLVSKLTVKITNHFEELCVHRGLLAKRALGANQSTFFNCFKPQDKEGILPVATLSIALYVLRRSRSDSNVAPEMAILLSAL